MIIFWMALFAILLRLRVLCSRGCAGWATVRCHSLPLKKDSWQQDRVGPQVKKKGRLNVLAGPWFGGFKCYSLEGDAAGGSCFEAFCLFGAPLLSAGKDDSSTTLVCCTVKVPPSGTK